MTINSEIRKVGPFIGNGTASAFPFTFKVFQASDLEVVRLEVSTNVETVLTLNSQYTVTLNVDQDSNPGGTVTLIGGALASGYTLTLTSDVPYLQPTDLTNQGGFYPDVINDALDRATIQIQQLGVDVNRSIKVAVSSDVNTELPVPNANDLLGWDSTGTSLTNVDPSTLATVVAYATAYADVFIGDGVTTSFVLTRPAGSLYNLDVSIQGVTQEPVRDYTLSGTTITFTTAPFDTHRVLVKYKEGLPNYEGDSQDVRYLPTGTGAVATTVQAKLRETISVKDFGAVGNGVTDDTTAIQNAINAISTNGGVVYFPASSGSYMFTALTVSGDNIELNLASSVDLRQTVLNGFGITVSGNYCSITGNGAISSNVLSLSDYDTTGSGIARAIVKVTGSYFTAQDIQVNTPSRCGFFVDNAEGARFDNLSGDGGYLYADYNPASTLNLYAVYFDPPTRSRFSITNCSFRRYISPIGSGNLTGISGSSSGSQIIGNRFVDCYDHAVYLLNCNGVLISNNYCQDVRKPFVIDGTGAQITNNVCIATGTTQTNHELGFSLRDCSGAVVSGNRLEGRGAYIDLAALNATDLTDCEITNNYLISTAASPELSASIRVASTTSLCLRNTISNNTIKNVSAYNASQGVITMQGNASFIAANNQVIGNNITITADATGFQMDYCNFTIHKNNIYDRSGYSAGSPTTVINFYATNSNNILTQDNEHRYRTGGTNVTAYGVSLQASCNFPVVSGERNAMTSGSLAAVSLIPAPGTGGYKTRNYYNIDYVLAGTVTLGSGVANVVVNNANVVSGSRIYLTPANGNAGAQQSNYTTHKGIYAKNDYANARFYIETGDGNLTTVSGNWFWEIDG